MRWSAEATIRIPAARDDVFEVLSSVEELSSWLPFVSGARLLAAEGDVRVVELIGTRAGVHRTVFEIIASEPESILFTQVDRDRRRGISGELVLLDGEAPTVVRARLRVPSAPWRLDERRRLRAGLAAALEALRRRCGAEERPPGSRRLLSIRRRPGGSLELWLEGRIYDLVPRVPGGAGPIGG